MAEVLENYANSDVRFSTSEWEHFAESLATLRLLMRQLAQSHGFTFIGSEKYPSIVIRQKRWLTTIQISIFLDPAWLSDRKGSAVYELGIGKWKSCWPFFSGKGATYFKVATYSEDELQNETRVSKDLEVAVDMALKQEHSSGTDHRQ